MTSPLAEDWRKSSWSSFNGNCIEVALRDGVVLVRDSKDPGGPVLECTPAQWAAFLRGARNR